MKKFFLSIIIATSMLATAPVHAAATSVSTKGDTTIIVDQQGDSTIITSKVNGLVEKIVNSNIFEHLDDTIVDSNKDYEYNDESQESNRDETFISVSETWSRAVRDIVSSLGIANVFIIFIVLLFRYMNRRRKYKVIEKAIENNYQLPEGIMGNGTPKVVYTAPQYVAPATPLQDASSQDGTTPPPFTNGATQPISAYPMQTHINWHAIKGIGLIVTGLGGIIFGLCTGATPLAAIFCIPLMLGAFKAFVSYMDQRNAILTTQFHQQQMQQTAQQQNNQQ